MRMIALLLCLLPATQDVPAPAPVEATPVRDALKWLARHQGLDGSWNPSTFNDRCRGDACKDGAGDENRTGVTGLALLAFLRAGHGLQAGKVDDVDFGATVRAGVTWLVKRQQKNGALEDEGHPKQLYQHAVATYALALASKGAAGPAFPKADAEALTRAVRLAAWFIVDAQNPGKGWRYLPRPGDNDSSATAWCVQALAAGRDAGVKVADEAFDGAMAWYDEVTDEWGKVGYHRKGTGKVFVPGRNESFKNHDTLAAAAALARTLIKPDAKRESDRRAAVLITEDLPAWKDEAIDEYYWYWGTAFLAARDTHSRTSWIPALRKALEPVQHGGKGCDAGSWDPVGRWGYEGGRVYMTAISALSLSLAGAK